MEADDVTCVCGLPIVPGVVLQWTHAINPGRGHHYAKPRKPLPPTVRPGRLSAMQQMTDAR